MINPQPKPEPRLPARLRDPKVKVRDPRLDRKKAKPEKYCTTRGCPKTALYIERCGTHADEHLLKLRRAFVVKDHCELYKWHRPGGPLGDAGFECMGPLQDNHGFDRGYKRGNLRWDPRYGFSGCASANFYAKFHREEWHDFLRSEWGEKEYERLRQITVRGPRPDHEEALAMLSGRKEGKG